MTREEAIRKVRCELSGLPFDKDVREAFETLIPELKPGDETTRNEILAYIGSKTDIDLETHNRWCSYLEKQEQKPEAKAGDNETEAQEECDDRSFILDLLEEQLRYCKKNQEGARRSKRIRSAMDWVKSTYTENAVDEEDEKVRKWLLEYFYLHRDDLRGASVTSTEVLSFLENHPGKGEACDVEEFSPKPGEEFRVRCKTEKSEWFGKGDERPAYAATNANGGIMYIVRMNEDGTGNSVSYQDKEKFLETFDILDGKTDGQWPNLSNCKHDCRTCFARCFYRKERNPEQ